MSLSDADRERIAEEQRRANIAAVLQSAKEHAAKPFRAEIIPYAPQPAPKPKRIRWLHDVITTPTRAKWLIRDILEEQVIALLAGTRGTYKSFIALHWAMTIAMDGREVLIISAEGAGMDRRCRAWLSRYGEGRDPAELKVAIIEKRIDFNSADAFAQLVQEIEDAGLHPCLVVIDTLSKNSGGLDENSNSEVKAFIGRLDDGLKRKYGCTVLLIHHTGHMEKGRARGASALEADTDAAYVITRTPGCHTVSVTRERFKDSGELDPLVYNAEVVDLGELDEYDRPVTSLVLVPGSPDAIAAEAKTFEPRGSQQRQLLRVLKQLQAKTETVLVWTSEDIKRIGRDSGMARATARDAGAALCSFYLMPCTGGYRLKNRGEE